MTDRYTPSSAEIRTAAERTIGLIDALAINYQLVEGVDLKKRQTDPVIGAHANLRTALDLGDITNPLRQLTQSSLTLERVGNYPSIKILPLESGSDIGLVTPRTVFPLHDQRIDRIYSGEYYVPRRVVLLNRFGRQTPADLIGKARREAEREAKRGTTIFSRFTGRSR